MNDILPPRRQIKPVSRELPKPKPRTPTEVPAATQPDVVLPTPLAAQSPITPAEPSPTPGPDQPSPRRRIAAWKWWAGGVLLALVLGLIAGTLYFQYELQPVSKTAQTTTRVTVAPDSSTMQIAQLLSDEHLIRSKEVFYVYARATGSSGKFQKGAYNLSATMSLPAIVDHLVSGKTDNMRITFLPGVGLRPNPNTPAEQRTDVESVLLRVGFKRDDIEPALTKQYQHPLFDGRPAGADLEGYVYGETYDFPSDATLDDIFNHIFDTYYAALQANGVIDTLRQENMTLYQGITLASIIQREVSASDPSTASHDQQQVAQVFMVRLARGMPLGSDVTAYYGAIKINHEPSVAVDTPYNTRLHAGLPPGPIATPSIGALEAVAHPAAGDYLFFLSGDDDVMYYAHTDAEHQANIKAHCKVKCAVS